MKMKIRNNLIVPIFLTIIVVSPSSIVTAKVNKNDDVRSSSSEQHDDEERRRTRTSGTIRAGAFSSMPPNKSRNLQRQTFQDVFNVGLRPDIASTTLRPTPRPTPLPLIQTNNNAGLLSELNKRPTTSPSESPTTLEPTDNPTESPTTPYPTVDPQSTGSDQNNRFCGMATTGTLILHGGIFNYSDPWSDELGRAMVDNMPTDADFRISEPLVFLPGARQEITNAERAEFEEQWDTMMSPGVPFSVMHADSIDPAFTDANDAEEADTEEFAAPLRDAMGVFLPGGRQWRLIDAYKYTLTEEYMWNVLERGGLIVGTSAGAAAMGSNMIRGDPMGSNNLIAGREWYRHGLGFLRNVVIDNHIDTRQREMELYDVLNDGVENRKLLGIGLNENTMIIVKGRYFQVRGDNPVDSTVRVYDCSKIPETEICTFDNAPFESFGPGDWYNLCDRNAVIPPTRSELYTTANQRSLPVEYGLPYEFKSDYKSGHPKRFLCSGRRCRWKSSRIDLRTRFGNDNEEFRTVEITGKVFMDGNGSINNFQDGDQLFISYSINDDEMIWRTIFNTEYDPLSNYAFDSDGSGRDIRATIPVPSSTESMKLQIVAYTSNEDIAEFEVEDLKVELN